MEQFLDALAPDRRDDSELGKMGADRIDHRGLLPDEQMARAVEHEAALLLRRLGRHEPHVRPGDRFADGLSVSGVILLPFDVGLYVGWRHQAHCMAKGLELTRPVMRRGASLDADQARRQLLKERQNVPTLQLTAEDHLASSINAVNLED
jgi:hypothetical protein